MKKTSGKQSSDGPRWWQVALITVAVSLLGALSSGGGTSRDRRYYSRNLKKPAWSPPGWLFGPAWSVNNLFLVRALWQLLRNRQKLPQRNLLLVLQALIWIDFFSFGYVQFKKRSPVLGSLWTILDAAFAATSFVAALKADRRLAAHYAPLMLWTGYASSVAIPIALKNKDYLLGNRALLN